MRLSASCRSLCRQSKIHKAAEHISEVPASLSKADSFSKKACIMHSWGHQKQLYAYGFSYPSARLTRRNCNGLFVKHLIFDAPRLAGSCVSKCPARMISISTRQQGLSVNAFYVPGCKQAVLGSTQICRCNETLETRGY